ncbi:polysaccharide lyase 6 family protein [Pontibacter sp. E15-1]|uniref:polysaccharide lyase 6 family protein n=1 Tax=Pontibacter sp. E15-1 TaxID=2919918 RepID=UPI001F4FF237|nr:polysaccharide lyase 6 family protein [Pontibacter sp. E15-1]MCJ8163240.1 polysaccharide lyase 6 family protein [Pontibacter sp. E15-1]
MKKLILILIQTALTVASCSTAQVSTPSAGSAAVSQSTFAAAVAAAQPGDTMRMAAGSWTDARLVFEARGTADKPIVLMAEKPGAVRLEGKSSLKIAGEYLVVSGLVFVNGHTPDDAVISFRKDKDNLANNCRVTACVIDGYNQEDRFKSDYWVELYGRNNRVDHTYLNNKLNSGVTLVVRLNSEASQQNHHRIDHNYFGERPRLGSNGGETMRIGTSTFSLTSSHTIVENNYFYRCNGEVEVVSVKSGDNIIRNNTFYESEGVLALRHGNNNLVEGNYFIGNNRRNTGGIRVINAGHTIRNNYFQGLEGDRFFSALGVMNGVPNSSINRYHQVKDVLIEDNAFINCANVTFGVGSDNERTAVPQNVKVRHNIFYNPGSETVFKALDDISGVTFADNKVVTASASFKEKGFERVKLSLSKNAQGLWASADGTLAPALPADAATTGVSWYTPEKARATQIITKVTRAANALEKAVLNSTEGDIIELQEAGEYVINQTLTLPHTLTIRAKAGLSSRPVVNMAYNDSGMALLSIQKGGSIRVEGIAFNGFSEGGIAENAIRTSTKPMIRHYNLFVDNCAFYGFNESSAGAFRAYQSTFADTISFTNSTFQDISGVAINLAAEKEDKGKYNAESVTISNCLFDAVMGSALDLYRGGNDESTAGPFLTVDHCTFNQVNNTELGSVLRLIGVQWAEVRNSIFSDSGKGGRAVLFESSRWAHNKIDYCNLYRSGKIESFYNDVTGKHMFAVKPEYTAPEKGNFQLKPGATLLGKGSDGKPLGALWNNGFLSSNEKNLY